MSVMYGTFELPDKILLSGHQIDELPIKYKPRTYADGKKITVIDGLKALLIMFRDRLGLSPVLKPNHHSGSVEEQKVEASN